VVPAYVESFDIPRRLLSEEPQLYRPADPDFREIQGRKDRITGTTLYCGCAWLERLHNLQSDSLAFFGDSEVSSREKVRAAVELAEYNRFVLFKLRDILAARYDTIRTYHSHGAAYSQAVEEFVSEIPSDFKSSAAGKVAKSLRRAQLKHATRAQAQSAWGPASSSGAGPSSSGKARKGGRAKKSSK